MTAWDGFNFKGKDCDQPSEYDMISSLINDAKYSNGVSRQCADPDKGLGDDIRVDVVRQIVIEISEKIRKAREKGKYEARYALWWYFIPLCNPCPTQKEAEIICNMLQNKGYDVMIYSEFYTFIYVNWMLIEHPIWIK